MSEYKLEIAGNIQLSDYSSIHDYIGLIGEGDKLTILINGVDIQNYQMVCNILENDDFEVCTREAEIDGKYYITAYRKRQK